MRLPRLLLATGQPTAIDYSSIMLLTRRNPAGAFAFQYLLVLIPFPPPAKLVPGLLTLAVGSPIFGALYDKPWYCAARLRAPLIVDAEVVPLSKDGIADFDALYNRLADERLPLIERKNALRWVLRNAREGIRYVKDNDGDGQKMFDAVSKLGLEGIVSKRLSSVYRSGPSRTWLKTKNPKSPATTRVEDGTF